MTVVCFDGFMEMLDRLDQARGSMNGAKNSKLAMRWGRHGDYNQWPVGDVVDHLYKEWVELTEALESAKYDIGAVRDEVVDVVNILEMLWDILDLGVA